MSERSSRGCLLASAIWIVILGILAVAARYLVLPYFDEKLTEETGTASAYRHTVTLAADSFSGYAVFRSPVLRALLGKRGIRLVVQDDKGDFPSRMEALASGKAQLAVFTVDSFITAGAGRGGYPATMIALIDETAGADALVAYQSSVPDVQALNSPEARIVLTAGSPSEFLARSVIARFHLPLLPEGGKWMIGQAGAEDVYRQFRADGRKDLAGSTSGPRAYALWEPYVSLALREPGAHVLIDSSRLRGHIVDVLAADRKFVSEQPEVAREVLEAYFTAVNYYMAQPERLQQLLIDDARDYGGQTLTPEQARKLAGGIEWKNTLQNYAAFGVQSGGGRDGRLLLEDVIRNVTEVLLRTQSLQRDPAAGAPGQWYYARLLTTLRDSGFRPGSAETADGSGKRGELPALSAEDWKKMLVIGNMRVPPVTFGRGTARLNTQSKRDLEALAKTLESFPWSYLRITGCTRPEGDEEANRKLAQERAQAALEELAGNGVSRSRLQATTVFATEQADARSGGGAQTVIFELLQQPF